MCLCVDPPDEIKISTSSGTAVGDSYDIKEGNGLTLDCEAQQANPADVTYKWTKEKDLTPHSSRLQIANINRRDAGVYMCTVTNQMTPSGRNPVSGTGEKNVTVNVQCELFILAFVFYLLRSINAIRIL